MTYDLKNIGDKQLESIDLIAEMELNSCECDKNCPESVSDEELVRCGFCEKYISYRCIVTHIEECHHVD